MHRGKGLFSSSEFPRFALNCVVGAGADAQITFYAGFRVDHGFFPDDGNGSGGTDFGAVSATDAFVS